jgi:hypothetical protein
MNRVGNVNGNFGIVAGGDATGNSVKNVIGEPREASADDALLEEINELLDDILKGVRQLPPEQRGTARAEVMELQAELEAPTRDKQKIGARLGKLKSAISTAVPLVELVNDVAELLKVIH